MQKYSPPGHPLSCVAFLAFDRVCCWNNEGIFGDHDGLKIRGIYLIFSALYTFIFSLNVQASW